MHGGRTGLEGANRNSQVYRRRLVDDLRYPQDNRGAGMADGLCVRISVGGMARGCAGRKTVAVK
jgi:hypothetical protein